MSSILSILEAAH